MHVKRLITNTPVKLGRYLLTMLQTRNNLSIALSVFFTRFSVLETSQTLEKCMEIREEERSRLG